MGLKPLIAGMSQSSSAGGARLRPLVGGLAQVPSGGKLTLKPLIAGMSQSPSTATGIPVNLTPPVVSPINLVQEMRVSCTTGTWTNSPNAYAYQWLADGAPIVGETSSSYLVQAGDVGAVLSCEVTASNAFGPSAAPEPSNDTDPVLAGFTYFRPGGADVYFRSGGTFLFIRP